MIVIALVLLLLLATTLYAAIVSFMKN